MDHINFLNSIAFSSESYFSKKNYSNKFSPELSFQFSSLNKTSFSHHYNKANSSSYNQIKSWTIADYIDVDNEVRLGEKKISEFIPNGNNVSGVTGVRRVRKIKKPKSKVKNLPIIRQARALIQR